MILKLNEQKQKELRKKATSDAIRMPLIMCVINIVIIVLGVYTAYYAYLKLGIDSMTNLLCFILGIALTVLGISRFFDFLGTVLEKGFGSQKWVNNIFMGRIYNGIPIWIESLSLELTEEGIVYDEKSSNGIHCFDLDEHPSKSVHCVLDWSKIRVFCFNDLKEVHVRRKYGPEYGDISSSAVALSDKFDGFDYDLVVKEFKKYLPEESVEIINEKKDWKAKKEETEEQSIEEVFGESKEEPVKQEEVEKAEEVIEEVKEEAVEEESKEEVSENTEAEEVDKKEE